MRLRHGPRHELKPVPQVMNESRVLRPVVEVFVRVGAQADAKSRRRQAVGFWFFRSARVTLAQPKSFRGDRNG